MKENDDNMIALITLKNKWLNHYNNEHKNNNNNVIKINEENNKTNNNINRKVSKYHFNIKK